MLALDRLPATRIVATPAALDALRLPPDRIALRLAPDELWVSPPLEGVALDDPHAIVVRDVSMAGVWLPEPAALHVLTRTCEWALPTARPAFAQGAVAGLAAKLYFAEGRVLVLVAAVYSAEMQTRLTRALSSEEVQP